MHRVAQRQPDGDRKDLATMNDDTTRSDGWGSTDPSSNNAQTETQGGTQPEGDRVGFCQDCGKPLTQTTMRAVGAGVFCEPCLTARVGVPTPGYAAIPPTSTDEPSPALAAILGFIPGVGAMYNGQFAKGVVHLAIFAILVSLSSYVNGIFGLFVAGWEFYMVFEAYHTAIARRDGLALPNAFGFNDIGERMGFGKGWGNTRPVVVPPAGPVPVTEPYTNSTYPPINPVPVGTAPDWVGYVPPTAFTSAAAYNPTAAQASAQAATNAGYTAPYAEAYTGPTQTPYQDPYAPLVPPIIPETTGRRFPTGAFWLIGLGVLILAANLLPDWKLTARWWPPLLFAGLSIWTFTRRLHSGARLICIIRWPVTLMVLAIMFALHAAYVPVTFGLTASILLIVFGALLLAERAAGSDPAYVPPVTTASYSGMNSVVPPSEPEAPTRAAWESPVAGNATDPDGTKGGQ
jgi:TM2 domain-containing membrane protein YozV